MIYTDLQTTADEISQRVEDLEVHLEELHTAAARLKTLDPTNATPYYHRKKYLYLIHPQRNGERIREYIGSKPEKIAAALARVQAHRDLVEVQRQAADVRARLDLVARYLDAALRAAEGGAEER